MTPWVTHRLQPFYFPGSQLQGTQAEAYATRSISGGGNSDGCLGARDVFKLVVDSDRDGVLAR